MTRRRWIADEVSGNSAVLLGSHALHLSRVLRASVGQEYDIVTPTGVRSGQIISVADDRVEFELGGGVSAVSSPAVSLLLSIFKFDRLEWAIEKCTELGVASIIPVISRRTESHLAVAASKRVERWRRIATQASEQSRRSSPPEIAAPLKFKEAIAMEAAQRIVLSETEHKTMLKDLLQDSAKDGLFLALGPEGGWTPDELKLFGQTGWKFASLGATILRAETAAIAATAIAISELQA
jgi:16S rRNA (uracil1498-N3)-methyltransferase